MGGFPRSRWVVAVAALLAAALPTASVSQEAPRDPVSGLPIPLLTGQVFEQVKKGCWIIEHDTSFAYLKTRWIGACRYGVIDGPGLLVHGGYDGKPPIYSPVRSHLGQILFEPIVTDVLDRVIIPRSTEHPLWEYLTIYRRNIADLRGMLNQNVSELPLVIYRYRGDNYQIIREQLSFNKEPCPADSNNPRDIKKHFSPDGFNPNSFSERDISRLTEFCLGAVKKLWGDAFAFGRKSFDNVDYGYYHFAYVERRVELNFGRLKNALVETRTPSLCPNLSTPVGCEAVWQRLLAPYEAKFAQLKPQEAAAEAARRADAERRFAPLTQAWRAKIADLLKTH